jgi:sugar-specific transcriptional regulator TrmB
MYEQYLMSLGLTAGETRVYVSLLRLGPSKVGSIVRESKVSYSKVYDVLDRLGDKGLVSHITKGQVKHFSAVEPYRLRDFIARKEQRLQEQRSNLDAAIPDLMKLVGASRRNSAEIFSGLRGIRNAYEVLLSESKPKDVLRYFYPFDDLHESASPFYSRLYAFQKHKKLDQRGIGTIAFRKSDHYKSLPADVKMRFVNFPLPGTMDIFGERMIMISWESPMGILVSSREITDHFKRYFDSIWKIAEK